MDNNVKSAEEMGTIVNELCADVAVQKKEQKMVEEQVRKMDEGLQELYRKLEGWEGRFLGRMEELLGSSKTDTSSLEAVLKQGLHEVNEEVKKQHVNVYETKRYSVFGDRFGAEQFAKVADTVMKWLVVLIIVFTIVYVVKLWAHHQLEPAATQKATVGMKTSSFARSDQAEC